ncbi:Wyosine [tRNA(Phe)-imidazoG37] synthetase, radical SAM superfamily [Desulfacinum hydrothermale DSM 13146]|uniref:Wyosine [tRNA(Phe)-imidazoG37] synthetase, radical SAM superfamily n=1 Tax=Desulfacinum hydrothermale DSM 13146 TaxID=1121390 RepID=A0A1W1X0S2_9BACT|nr:radical SAM protein [Desulfacinum hydrothermale]SMC16981.1 Wyosine [tRNA(Phe)-imidazoG37] synthetase, radical SAM superfamily [Desulfacinum hydrothermale DSM 13146]
MSRREVKHAGFLFGPVPSRRLGRSLGIDVIPAKTCSLDCIYCESGSTTHLTLRRRAFFAPDPVMAELEAFLRRHGAAVDVLTFSAAGEPTLYQPLGELAGAIKRRFPEFPLVMLTNGTLLWDPAVRRDLLPFDRVIPSLDAADEETFARLNRPHPRLEFQRVLEGLRAFRRDYGGQYHLEIVLARGVNDSPEHLHRLARLVEGIGPDRVELNTVVRPPADPVVQGLEPHEMERAAVLFPAGCTEVIGSFRSRQTESSCDDLPDRIVALVRRRPCTPEETADVLGAPVERVLQAVVDLEREGRLVRRRFHGGEFLCGETGTRDP